MAIKFETDASESVPSESAELEPPIAIGSLAAEDVKPSACEPVISTQEFNRDVLGELGGAVIDLYGMSSLEFENYLIHGEIPSRPFEKTAPIPQHLFRPDFPVGPTSPLK